MKRLLLILTILISGVVSSQSFYFKCFDNTELLEITDMFFEDAKLDIEDWDIDVKFYYKEINVGGYAQTYCGIDKTNIFINKYIWDLYFTTDVRKFFVLYHELGHGILKLDHVCINKDIMATSDPNLEICKDFTFPTNFPVANMNEFNIAKERMFAGTDQIDLCSSNKGSKTITDIFNN